MARPDQFVIAGVGNVLLTDDGVGVHAIRELEKEPIPGVTMLEVGTSILDGIACLENAHRVLVIDAAVGGQPPGTIYLFDNSGDAESSPFSSVHALGLREALHRFGPPGARPAFTTLGVEPASLRYGLQLSPRLQTVLPQVVILARKTISKWLGRPAELIEQTPRTNPALS